ncbi:diaminopimelate decarboxylase [Dongia mobilis]|uniref:Diaminopimelate decarboxylase n=1 Tax=Dongia mobilis TaxID=578943 RepID=A0A4R6WV69_9PROT|nr:diaminopimelate decarboxylase [Dongia mobilis]TDQ83914.1 diaminopimelate decarboxylase [Dongia mobilis]
MSHFHYRDGAYHAEGVGLAEIAAAIGTPFYCYSTGQLSENFGRFQDALGGLNARLYYSCKANSNQAVIKTLAQLGAGADVVSVGEMYRALAAGIAAHDIVFAGVGKTRDEMWAALEAGIYQFNVESVGELRALNEVALALGKRAPVALRINPDVDAKTHAKISTGKAENKFGIDIDHAPAIYAEAAALPGIAVKGLACHIGSQLIDIAPFRAAFQKMADLVKALRGKGLAVERVDLGGGVGITYRDEQTISFVDYTNAVAENFGNLGLKLEAEPGRAIVGNAGILVARVINVKEGVSRNFVIVDAAMNDLIRPTLYDAYHQIVPVIQPADDAAVAKVDVVGPICETGDLFAEQRALPPLAVGDLVVFREAGAYGAVMSSTYNTRPLVPEVLVKGDKFEVVRPRQTYDAIIGQDILPSWL